MDSIHTEKQPRLETVIPEMLSLTTVKRNHVGMYRVGKTMLQESAYAVYMAKDKLQTSRLYVPELRKSIYDAEDSEAEANDKYHGIILQSLVEVKMKNTQIRQLDQFAKLSFDEKYESSSEFTRRTIDGIMAENTLSPEEKEMLCEKAFEREMTDNNPSYETYRPRDDVLSLVHNHPQFNTSSEYTFDLLVPSGTDVIGHEETRRNNPVHVSGIVTSDRTTNGMLLFAAESNRQQDSHGYDATIEHSRGAKYNLRQLARSGFTYIVLGLDDHGAVIDGQQDELVDFARSIKTK